MKNIKLSSEQQKAAAILFYDFHKSPSEIARRFEIGSNRIAYILNKAGNYKDVLSQMHGARTARGHLLAKSKS